MTQEPVVIPEKLYFKIGEVCELVGVQAHVLRYWETEFSMLSPQKNKSGQRSYRRRDVEMALRVKQLLYKEMFTIAGARKKLQSEQRDGSKTAAGEKRATDAKLETPSLFDGGKDGNHTPPSSSATDHDVVYSNSQQNAIKKLTADLLELRDMLKSSSVS